LKDHQPERLAWAFGLVGRFLDSSNALELIHPGFVKLQHMNEHYFDPSDAIARAPRATTEVRFRSGRGLTRLEKELLGYLTANCGRPVSRNEILSSVWHLNPTRIVTRTVDMHIATLRHKLRSGPDKPGRLVTIRGQGYMLVKES
jgi:hypothetical protein